MVTIRRAVPEDAPGIARVHDTALRRQGRDHYDEDELDAMAPAGRDPGAVDGAVLDRADRYVAVAEANGDVVGVAGVHLEAGALLGVFVSPDATGEGIGAALLDAVESEARAAGLDVLTIRSALNAVGFYEACGFERTDGPGAESVGGPLGPYDDDVDIPAVALQKRLSTD